MGDFDFGKPEKEPDRTDLSHLARKAHTRSAFLQIALTVFHDFAICNKKIKLDLPQYTYICLPVSPA